MREVAMQAGDRGFSVLLADETNSDPTRRVPGILFRAYDEGQEQAVRIEATVPVSVVGRMGITFCPWCGQRLYTGPAQAQRG
jgi:hypothetical protein